MGGGVDKDRWAVAGDGMKADARRLVVLVDMLGNGEAQGPITLPYWAANAIAAILSSLPGRAGRPRRKERTLPDLSCGKSLNARRASLRKRPG